MNEYDELEAKGQTNIFDFLLEEHDKKEMGIGDKVMIRFYVDELEYIRSNKPWMLGVGQIVGVKLDFWLVNFDGKELLIEKNRLILEGM